MNQETIPTPNNETLNASIQQKSNGISLVVINTIAIYYFVNAYELAQNGQAMLEGFGRLALTALVLIIVAEIVLQTVLANDAGRAEGPTRRDQRVALLAGRNGYGVMATGLLAVFGSALLGSTPFVMANIALLSFVLAEVTRFVSQLIYHRRSAS